MMSKKKEKKDVLATIFEFPFDILNNRCFRTILYSMTVIYAFLILLQLFYMLYIFNADVLSSNGPLCFVNLFHFVTFLLTIHYMNQKNRTSFFSIFKENLWDIKETSHAVRTRILRKSKIVCMIYKLIFVYHLVIDVYLCYYVSDKLENVYLPYYFVRHYCPRWLGTTILSLTVVVTCLTTGLVTFVVIYFSCHLQYQLLMVGEKLRQITKYSSVQNGELSIRNKLYQMEIKKQLTIIVQRHSELKNLASKYKKYIIRTSLTMIVISSVPVAISCTSFGLKFGKVIEPGLLFISYAVQTFVIMYYGQHYGDEFMNIFDLSLHPSWYTWKVPNRRIYLIFLCNALQPVNTHVLENLGTDYQTLVTLFKAIFTVANVLYGFYKE